jgi:carbon-monoxide dehydrogenase small subunit
MSERGLAKIQIGLMVNGLERRVEVEPRTLLVHALRDELGLTGTKIGCDTSQCGACTVLADGRSLKSCTVLAVQAEGRTLTTIEGLSGSGELGAVQQAFKQHHGLQCGYCTPGMVLSTVELLERNPDPNEAEIRHGLSGNLCRCTGYMGIVQSVTAAAEVGR